MDHDNSFGPPFPGLFDFTLLFEQSMLLLLPACIFIVLAALRIYVLWKRRASLQMTQGPILWAKLVRASSNNYSPKLDDFVEGPGRDSSKK